MNNHPDAHYSVERHVMLRKIAISTVGTAVFICIISAIALKVCARFLAGASSDLMLVHWDSVFKAAALGIMIASIFFIVASGIAKCRQPK